MNTIGIDGNMWYVSNGACLGSSQAEFSFERTLREAIKEWNNKFARNKWGDRDQDFICPTEHVPYLDMTPEEYKENQ